MGFFTPKISRWEKEHISGLLKQAQESAKLVNTTVKPDVYFDRLHFLFDILLELREYERYKIFRGSTPSNDLLNLQNGLEKSVDDFILRPYTNRKEKADALKTENAKQNNICGFNVQCF